MDAPWRRLTEQIQGPPGPGKFLSASASWTPGSIASGTVASTTISVPGAVVGQPAAVGFSVDLAAGAFMLAQVSAANTVRVIFLNLTGSPYTPGAGVVTAFVLVQG